MVARSPVAHKEFNFATSQELEQVAEHAWIGFFPSSPSLNEFTKFE
jgi:hypothetical protein